MSKVRVGINGMGRIGGNICRVICKDLQDHVEIVAMNDIVDPKLIARSMERDSVHGPFPVSVASKGDDRIVVGPYTAKVTNKRNPAEAEWGALGVDVVLECTGLFLEQSKAQGHLDAGAKKVIMSAPPKDKETPVFVVGVNDEKIAAAMKIVSNASCTTNCLAPMVKVLDDAFGIVTGLMSTTHAATLTQNVLDGIGGAKKRQTLNNIVPASTGAAKAIGRVMTHLDGKLNGTALRVPTDDVSVVEAMFVLKGEHKIEDIVAEIKKRAEVMNQRSVMKTILYFGDHYEVSLDAKGSSYSSMVTSDNPMAITFDGYTHLKLTSFYDNEIGYSYRMCDLAIKLNAV